MLVGMFTVSEAEAAAIRAAYELCRYFWGIDSTAKAREFARTIAGWKPLPELPTAAAQAQKEAPAGPGPKGCRRPRE